MDGGTPTGRVDQWRVLASVALLGLPNLVGAVLVFVFQNYLVPDAGETPQHIRDTTGLFAAYVFLSSPVAGVCGYLILRPVGRWLREARPPDEDELAATLAAPRRVAALGFAFWLVALAVFGGFSLLQGDLAREILTDGMATLLGGMTTAVLSFLLVESWMRPVVSLALDGRPPPRRHRTGGIGARILLSWALGSGVPLLGAAAVQLRFLRGGTAPEPIAVMFLALLGLVSGALLLALAARSVSRPVAVVRAALARVQTGDEEVEVAVDDAGQIGQLQAGFNEMMRGLRERRRLEDLFGRYVGPEVAADALARGTRLGGEKREVSALFVDIVDSTALASTADAAEVVRTLNDFFGAVVSVVTSEGGWVNKFEGDGALCVFGAPGSQPDHATRCLRAARRLDRALDQVARRRHGLSAGIGVSTGVVVAGHVGAIERFEYTVIGDAVNEAARLTDAAKERPERVLASGATVAAACEEERMCWQLADRLLLRGRSQVTELYAPREKAAPALAPSAPSTAG